RLRSLSLFPYTTLFRSVLGGPVLDRAFALCRVVVVDGEKRPHAYEAPPLHFLTVLHVPVRLIPVRDPIRAHRIGELLPQPLRVQDRKSTRLNSSHVKIS